MGLNFPKQLEDAVVEYMKRQDEMGELNSRHMDTLDQAFTSGAHFALKSELVRELVEALKEFHEYVEFDERRPNDPEHKRLQTEVIERALTKYSDAMKELER